jgi:ABC-type transporter Mla maintaining outer membrane lipid asymmetry permease subunit MlaE
MKKLFKKYLIKTGEGILLVVAAIFGIAATLVLILSGYIVLLIFGAAFVVVTLIALITFKRDE